MWLFRIAVALFVAFACSSAGAQSIATICVSAPTRDGFVDAGKEIQDSVKDIRGRLSGTKEFRVIEDRDKADLLLTVVTRGVGAQTYGERITYSERGGPYYANAQLTAVPMVAQTLWVSVVLEIGTYHKEFVGTAVNVPGVRWGRWSECASNVVKDIRSWATANRQQIKQRRR